MKNAPLFALIVSVLSLMSCASGPQRQPVAGGEMIRFPAQKISFFLPEGWKIKPGTKGTGRLMAAVRENDGQPGAMVFALIAAPEKHRVSVTDPVFVKSLLRSWNQKGFTKFSKPQHVTVGGHHAMRFEMQNPKTQQSMLNYTFVEQGQMIGLLFSYYGMPVTRGPAVQRIVDSFSIGR